MGTMLCCGRYRFRRSVQQDTAGIDIGHAQQGVLDLLGLDPVSRHFHLLINATEVNQVSILIEARQVASSIHRLCG